MQDLLPDVVQRWFSERGVVIFDFALGLFVVSVLALVFGIRYRGPYQRYRETNARRCRDPQHPADQRDAIYGISTMSTLWIGWRWYRVCIPCVERRKLERQTAAKSTRK